MLWYDMIIMLLFSTAVETASINHSKSVILLSLYTYSSVAKNLYDWVDCLTCVSNGDCLRSYYDEHAHLRNSAFYIVEVMKDHLRRHQESSIFEIIVYSYVWLHSQYFLSWLFKHSQTSVLIIKINIHRPNISEWTIFTGFQYLLVSTSYQLRLLERTLRSVIAILI